MTIIMKTGKIETNEREKTLWTIMVNVD